MFGLPSYYQKFDRAISTVTITTEFTVARKVAPVSGKM